MSGYGAGQLLVHVGLRSLSPHTSGCTWPRCTARCERPGVFGPIERAFSGTPAPIRARSRAGRATALAVVAFSVVCTAALCLLERPIPAASPR